jgi:Tol biopolymer transport system component
MRISFGPWTTAIHTGANPQLSTFWKRRMTMLPVLAMNAPHLRRRDLLRLAVLSGALLILPLIRLQDGATADEPAPKPKEERILYWWKEGRLATIRPDGKDIKWITEAARPGYHPAAQGACLSPDGRRVAYGITKNPAPPPQDQDGTARLYIKDLDDKGLGVDMGVDAHLWVWSPDGTQLAIAKWDREAEKQMKMVASHWLMDVKTKEKTELKIPDGHVITDWSLDGKWFLTTSITAPPNNKDAPPLLQLNLVKREGAEVRRLGKADLSAAMGRLSPDGKKVLFMKMGDKRGEGQLCVMTLADGKIQQASQELNAELLGYCWSPDSKRIAYVWRQKNPMPNGRTESFLMIVDADGKNPVTLLSEKSDNQGMITLSSPDWR